jgi:hypothetical protein
MLEKKSSNEGDETSGLAETNVKKKLLFVTESKEE